MEEARQKGDKDRGAARITSRRWSIPRQGIACSIELCLPAAQELNLNPSLLTGFLEEKFGLPAASANILRNKFLTADQAAVCLIGA
ncbi:MAG: hypothetical protein ACLVJH_14110 [Faecalibacterium prausnitzii]